MWPVPDGWGRNGQARAQEKRVQKSGDAKLPVSTPWLTKYPRLASKSISFPRITDLYFPGAYAQPRQEEKRRDDRQSALATDMPPSLISPVLTLPKLLAFRESPAQAQGRRRQAHSFLSLPADPTHIRSSKTQPVTGLQEQTACFSDGETEAQRS